MRLRLIQQAVSVVTQLYITPRQVDVFLYSAAIATAAPASVFPSDFHYSALSRFSAAVVKSVYLYCCSISQQ